MGLRAQITVLTKNNSTTDQLDAHNYDVAKQVFPQLAITQLGSAEIREMMPKFVICPRLALPNALYFPDEHLFPNANNSPQSSVPGPAHGGCLFSPSPSLHGMAGCQPGRGE